MRALLIDAYDSFVHTIGDYLKTLDVQIEVVRNDKIDPEGVARRAPDFVVLGPGPGHPADVGYVPIIRQLGSDIPMMGVCLGHQAIGLAYGGKVERAAHLMHGKTSVIEHDGQGCFASYSGPFHATRYHSLIVEKEGLARTGLDVTATAPGDGYVMGLRHRAHPVESVQFHPESILTEGGFSLFKNFMDAYVED